jgi:hypothetical protein
VINKILGFVLICFIFSCENQKDNFEKKYFDLEGFLQKQIVLIDHSEVKKMWVLDSSYETKNLKKLKWDKEFALFIQSDINKKAYLQSYSIVTTDNSIAYNLKANEDLPVKKMKVVFNEMKEVSRIEILQIVDNYLYSSNISLNLTTNRGKMNFYSIENNQKIIFGKMKHSRIKVEVL